MGVLPFSAFIWSTASRRLLGLSVATSGVMPWAWIVAVLIARSAACVCNTIASGSRNETRTSELVATTRKMMRSLMLGCGV